MQPPVVRRMRPLLGTFVEIGVHGDSHPTKQAIQGAFAKIESVQKALSFQDPDSELSRLNNHPGALISISPVTRHVLRLARAMMKASHGKFDFTVGGLLQMQGRLPLHSGDEAKPHGSEDDVELHEKHARLRNSIRITLDGIAKGYAVDAGICVLKRAGIVSGWINAGGDLRAFGEACIPVHIRTADRVVPLGMMKDAAIATSHTTQSERFPAHIVSKRGDAPAGVYTIMARHAWRADALTKVAALTRPTERERVVAELGGRLIVH